MPFLAERHVEIPNKDILSWTFDEQRFDIDKPIYIDASNTSRSISSRQAKVIIRKLAAGFHAAGLQPQDCVCLHSFNDIYYSMLFLGIIAAGGIFSGTNPSYTHYELVHHIKTSKSKFLITEPELLKDALKAAKECGIPADRVWVFDVHGQEVPKGMKSWKQLMEFGERDWVRFDDEKTSKTTTAARLFSSGTTGLPKAAVLSHHNFVAQHTLVHEINPRDYEISRPLPLPMFHAACVPVAHTTPLRAGHQSYVLRRFELELYLSTIQNHNLTEMGVVPPMALAIIMSPITKNYSLKCIKIATCGAAPMEKATQKRLKDLLADDAVCNQLWGMTETSCVATLFYGTESDETGSVGRPVPCMDMKIIDDEGNDITAYDTTGELCVRGPTIIAQYFENPAANADSFDAEGYFKTGDIVYCAKDTKKWYIIDRKKELIKVRGFQVAPPEIEGVLLSNPGIIDAAVIGIHKKGAGDEEFPRAYIVRRPGEKNPVTEEDVLNWCSKRLAKYKALTGGVHFVDSIPKNASGKILKRVLREEAKKELDGDKARL